MKKGLLASYVEGITDFSRGESYAAIVRYFVPEFVTALALYSILHLLDARFIADLKSTTMYATLGVTGTLLHFIIKVAEGMSVGTVIMCGQYNGAKQYLDVGRSFVSTFWTTAMIGICLSGTLYFGAPLIYSWYGVSPSMIELGVPFLRLQALGVLFMFLYFAFVAFLRSIKNTRTPMHIFILGGVAFVFFDYALIFGKFGFPQMGFLGSATATIIQYGVMLAAGIVVVLFKSEYRQYGVRLLDPFSNPEMIKRFMFLSWPVVLDKATLAIAYIWLGKMIAPMGECAMASFTVIKDMERFAFLPALAFAQIITLLASNDFGSKNIDGIKSNIKKVMFLSCIGVGAILLVFSLQPAYFISMFDHKGDFTAMAAGIFPLLSVLVLFDVFQVVLSGALRGASDVKMVMWTRLLVCTLIFMPITYLISTTEFSSVVVKFALIYGMFYLSNGIMSMLYINRFRSDRWKSSLN